jgi:predicted TIM-barrel fold metal-dependent hydrolase
MPIAGEPWRDALTRLSHHPNVAVKLSGQGTFVHAVDRELIADVTKVVLDTFGAGRAMFGSNFPIESLWTDFSSLIDAWLGVLAEYPDQARADVLGRTARRVYRLAEEEDHG